MNAHTVVGPVAPLAPEQLRVHPLGVDRVQFSSGFWADWQRANREVTTPHAMDWLEREGTVDNLRRLAPGATGYAERRGLWFTDSDVYKALEGIAWDLGRAPSAGLSALASSLSAVIASAQQEDGYLNSYVQAGLDVRWDDLVSSHELYCIGHLVQAAVAHHRATGSDELLDVARRAADCVARDFGAGRRPDTDGHEEIEMALVELYRETGHRPYLDLAQQLVDVRGHQVLPGQAAFPRTYYQDATPVRDETTVVGHAVRAMYLLCGVVDLYLESGEQALLDAALRQWESMTATKTYLTGAIGSRYEGEAFGDPYELPPDRAYGETCASIGNLMLSWRLLLATGESRFADAIERVLFNLLAASTSVDRSGFFYSNPVQRRVASPAAPAGERVDRADAPGTRPAWFACACCPPNIMRTVASLGAYVATHTASGVQLQQYVPASVSAPLAEGQVELDMSTGYPLQGEVTVVVRSTPAAAWTLSLRVPSWCRGARATVGGQEVPATASGAGYLEVERAWAAGDTVVLTLPMPVRLTLPHPSADALRGTVAIERGPLVFCLESPDQPAGVDLEHLDLLLDEPLHAEPAELLGQRSVVIRARGVARDDSGWGAWASLSEQPAAAGRPVELVAVPYHLWANRGPSTMRVFVPARR